MPIEESTVGELARLAELFQRLSDPTRLRVLCALAERGDHSIDELAAAQGVTRPTISRHLGELRRMGLVTAERFGQDSQFSLHPRVRSADGMLNLGRRVRIAFRQRDPWEQ